jgi:hypothetical protein
METKPQLEPSMQENRSVGPRRNINRRRQEGR